MPVCPFCGTKYIHLSRAGNTGWFRQLKRWLRGRKVYRCDQCNKVFALTFSGKLPSDGRQPSSKSKKS